ncbi:unnamed protein product [Brassica rapa]|uniref:Uncharacterized protein n=1 Tax=Brassica campestris TaxID=3711 RepID=A0A8D9DSQ1_BRACM|nr:unnamed protein product [Brassica rapa]
MLAGEENDELKGTWRVAWRLSLSLSLYLLVLRGCLGNIIFSSTAFMKKMTHPIYLYHMTGTLTDDDDDDDDDDNIRKTSILVSTNLCKVPRVLQFETMHETSDLHHIEDT